MKAIEIIAPGGPDVLRLCERADPIPGPGEVLIAVAYAGVNRPDVMQRQGRYPLPPGASDLPGLEVSGSIAAIGSGVTGWAIGDPCCALLNGGGYATLAIAPAGCCMPLPRGLTLDQAAALPETAFTVWANVFLAGELVTDETLLVHGGTSGIGVMAIQMAAAFGADVVTTCGSAEKAAFCSKLGASLAIDYRQQDFVAEVLAYTDGRGVDVVLDMVGGDYVARNLACLAPGGRHVSIATQSGAKATIDLMPVMQRRLVLTGSTLRPRTVAEKSALAYDLRLNVWPLIEAGRITPVIDRVFPLDQAAEAHAWLEAGNHIGKIVLQA